MQWLSARESSGWRLRVSSNVGGRTGSCWSSRREPAPALHQTGRNSCVLHAGVYYAPGSLKARLCTEGRRLLLDFCDVHEIPYEITGKLIVAVDESELGRLRDLESRARANGLRDVRLLDRRGMADVEPYVTGQAGLHIPETGLVDFRLVAAALESTLENSGGKVVYSTTVSRLREARGLVEVATDRGHLEAPLAVTCAGVHSDRLARASGAENDGVSIVPFRGRYFALTPDVAHQCRGLIYPVPDPDLPFLGVHVNRRPDGAVWVGPNAVLALAREGAAVARSTCTTSERPSCPDRSGGSLGDIGGQARWRSRVTCSRTSSRVRHHASCLGSHDTISCRQALGSARKRFTSTDLSPTTFSSPRPIVCFTSRTLPRRRPRRPWRSHASSPTERSRSLDRRSPTTA